MSKSGNKPPARRRLDAPAKRVVLTMGSSARVTRWAAACRTRLFAVLRFARVKLRLSAPGDPQLEPAFVDTQATWKAPGQETETVAVSALALPLQWSSAAVVHRSDTARSRRSDGALRW